LRKIFFLKYNMMKKNKLKKEKKLRKENPVYVRVDYEDALNAKKNLLSYQVELISMVKSIKKYGMLSESEGYLKTNLRNTLRAVNENIRKIEGNLPKVEEPKRKQEEAQSKEQPAIEYYNEDLESQLAQIRKKLEQIGK